MSAISRLDRWRADRISFIETVLHDPETGKPFELLDAERDFLAHAFEIGDDGRLLYSEQIFGAPKKSGKTGFAALHMLTTILLFGGRRTTSNRRRAASFSHQAHRRGFAAVKSHNGNRSGCGPRPRDSTIPRGEG